MADQGKVAEQSQARTSTKRKLVLKKGPYSSVVIGYEGGGETPDSLKGFYTSQAIAEKFLNEYMSTHG
jgi:hypothetical protein